jgi:ribosome-associated translation inhibitor RaiA
MCAAIDLLADKLDRQIIKHKEKHVHTNHAPGIKRINADQ